MDTHAPYEAPDQYQQKYLDSPVSRQRSQELARKVTHHPDELTEKEWELQRRLYKAECSYLDDQLSRLLDSVSGEAMGETIVVITADHGEMHGEHGLGGHPQQFWEEVIHVPCAVSIPGRNARQIDEHLGLIDIPPTILDSVDIKPPDSWDGRSMLPDTDGDVEERENVFVDVGAELNRDHAGLRRANGRKLMRHDENGELLINLDSNPHEDPNKNRIDQNREVYDEMCDTLDSHFDEMEKRRRGERGVEDEEMVEEHLRKLGYLE
jgi:arylsulfatase A-like enzyme